MLTRGSLPGLARACHPAPTVTVTVAVTALASAAGRDAAGTALVLVTVLIGQLSVGWNNDALDAVRDSAVGRTDKPIAAGQVSRVLVARAAVVALLISVVLSFVAAGLAGGACHVLFLASAWSYNLWLKRTQFSLVPYAVGFGALPGFVTYGLDPSVAPAVWATVAAGLLGIAAGLANAAPDVDDDLATDVRGAVGSLGASASRALCVVVLVAATVTLASGAELGGPVSVAAVVLVAIVGGAGLRVRDGAYLFPAVLAIALFDVALLITHADQLPR